MKKFLSSFLSLILAISTIAVFGATTVSASYTYISGCNSVTINGEPADEITPTSFPATISLNVQTDVEIASVELVGGDFYFPAGASSATNIEVGAYSLGSPQEVTINHLKYRASYTNMLSLKFNLKNGTTITESTYIAQAVPMQYSADAYLTPQNVPRLKIEAYSVSSESVSVESTCEIRVMIKNYSRTTTFENIYITIPTDSGAVMNGTNVIYVERLNPNSTHEFKVKYRFSADNKTDVYSFPLEFDYQYAKDGEMVDASVSESISIAVDGHNEEDKEDTSTNTSKPEKLSLQTLNFPETMMTYDEEEVTFNIVNKGYGKANHVEITIFDGNDEKIAYSYLGHIDSAVEKKDPKFTLSFEEAGTKTLKFVVSYQDYLGRDKQITQDMIINVEDYIDDTGADGPQFPLDENIDPFPYEEPEQESNTLFIVLLSLGAVILASVMAVVVIRRIKVKRSGVFYEDL